MKNTILFFTILILSFSGLHAQTPKPFITEWKSTINGTILIPTTGSGYNYNVSWKNVADNTDKGTQTGLTGDCTISGLKDTNVYQVEVTGDFPRIYFANGDWMNPNTQLQKITQWGDVKWKSMEQAFYCCTNLEVTALDTPLLAEVTNLSKMFFLCYNLRGTTANWHWHTNTITNMSSLFDSDYQFNPDVSSWDVSNVTDMSRMFFYTKFNYDINNWNVSKVTNMNSMFDSAFQFNQKLNNWEVSNVTDMSLMFSFASAFNQDINSWNVSKTLNMSGMFFYASAFNQDINSWNVNNVANMDSMFYAASSFNQSLDKWSLKNNVQLLNMLDDSKVDCNHYGSTLRGWASNPNTPNSLSLGASNLKYPITAQAAHDSLINVKTWTIVDDSLCNTTNTDEWNNAKNILSVFPNPSQGIFTIHSEGKSNYVITDLFGHIIRRGNTHDSRTRINLTNKAKGIYFLKMNDKSIKILVN